MATYNGEKYLKEQLDSIFSQSTPPYEVCICDDCSEDGTIGIIEQYKKKYNIRYCINSVRQGVNKNFYNAIKLCQGEYIMISDQDDVWAENKIELSLKRIKSLEQEFSAEIPLCISFSNDKIDSEGNIIHNTAKEKNQYSFRDMMFSHSEVSNQGCSLIFNRSTANILQTFPSKFSLYPYDLLICTVALCTGKKQHYTDKVFYHRIHAQNVSVEQKKGKKSIKSILNRKYYTFSEYFDCSLYKQRVLKKVYQDYNSIITNKDIRKDTENIIRYYDGYFPSKIKAICQIKDMKPAKKIKQIFFAILPLHIFRFMKDK